MRVASGLREASDRLEAAWANIRAQAAHVPYGEHPAIADPAVAQVMCATGFRIASPASTGPGRTSARGSIGSRFPRCTSRAGSTPILKARSRAILRCASHAGSEFARENQYLIAGPWVHIPWGDRAGDANFGEAANLNTDEILLRWFNHWLKDSRNSATSRGFATSRLAQMNGEARTSGLVTRSYRALSAQRRQCQFAQGRRHVLRSIPPDARSRAMYLFTIPRFR